MSQYTIHHPALTPEKYQLNSIKPSTHKIRALHISVKPRQAPRIIYTNPFSLLNQTYGERAYRCLHFDNWFHTYVSIFQGIVVFPTNIVATHLMRIHSLMDTGDFLPDSIYGDVIICGSAQYEEDPHDLSVPYEIVEQAFHIYEKIR